MTDFLFSYREVIESAESPFEKLAARVGAYYKVALSLAQRHPSWILVTHEDLCRDPINGFRKLYKKLGLVWTEKTRHIIQVSNRPKLNDKVEHVCRIAHEEINKWKHKLSDYEIQEIRKFYGAFNNEFYNHIV